MTLIEINNLTLDDVPTTVILRLLSNINGFSLSIDNSLTGFSAVIVNDAAKPSLVDAEAEFLIYQQELIDVENIRLIEVSRINDIETRIGSMNDVNMAHSLLNPNIPNSKLWIKENILEADSILAETNLTALENSMINANVVLDKLSSYETMTSNINTKMFEIFETTNRITANAYALSWKIKAENAIEYINEGLLDNLGNVLDTEAKIKTYYDTKVASVIAFDKYMDAQLKIYNAL